MIGEEPLRRQVMEYGSRTGQPTATKAVYCLVDLDLSIAPAGEPLEMDEDRVVIGSSEELYLHRTMYILGENCVHFHQHGHRVDFIVIIVSFLESRTGRTSLSITE